MTRSRFPAGQPRPATPHQGQSVATVATRLTLSSLSKSSGNSRIPMQCPCCVSIERVKQKLTLPERRCLLRPARRTHMSSDPTIIYTLTDEAPALATYAFLPIIRTFTAPAGVRVEESDISLAARILSNFPEYLTPEQRVPDTLAELGRKTLEPDANIIKLPNISASVPQLLAAIKELQAKGYRVPNYPGDPKTDEEKAIKARYARCIGSAVNPVLREGNSDRRAPRAVKEYARKNPHSMAEWAQASRSHVSHMHGGDFYHGEKSMTLDRARNVKMELITKSGKTVVLKSKVALLDREVIDSMFMSKKALLAFYEKEIEDAHKTGVMFSLHVKATMM